MNKLNLKDLMIFKDSQAAAIRMRMMELCKNVTKKNVKEKKEKTNKRRMSIRNNIVNNINYNKN
jgi:hypothetical protein